jgi:hypothetical protein
MDCAMLVGMEDKNQPGPKSRFAEVIRKSREKRDQMERLSKDRREEEKAAVARILREAAHKD